MGVGGSPSELLGVLLLASARALFEFSPSQSPETAEWSVLHPPGGRWGCHFFILPHVKVQHPASRKLALKGVVLVRTLC